MHHTSPSQVPRRNTKDGDVFYLHAVQLAADPTTYGRRLFMNSGLQSKARGNVPPQAPAAASAHMLRQMRADGITAGR